MKPVLKLVLLSCVVAFIAWIAVVPAQDTVDPDVDTLEKNVVEALVGGKVPPYPDKMTFKSAPSSVKVALIQKTLIWFRTFTGSETFKNDYRKQRDAAKPSPPGSAGVDEKVDAYFAEQRRSLDEMKQQLAQMPPDMRDQMQQALREMETEFQKTAKDPQMAVMLKQAFEQENLSAQQRYQEQLTAWEKQYPEDPKTLIAARLRQFMEVSGSVVFDAELVAAGQGKMMKFADPRYESQAWEWKLCYRAGQEPVQAARAFVGEWLKQIDEQ